MMNILVDLLGVHFISLSCLWCILLYLANVYMKAAYWKHALRKCSCVSILSQTRLQAQAAGVPYSHPLSNVTSRMAYFGPSMVWMRYFSVLFFCCRGLDSLTFVEAAYVVTYHASLHGIAINGNENVWYIHRLGWLIDHSTESCDKLCWLLH